MAWAEPGSTENWASWTQCSLNRPVGPARKTRSQKTLVEPGLYILLSRGAEDLNWAKLTSWLRTNLGGAIQFSLCIIFETESWNLVWNHWIRITIMISKILILALFSLHLGRANAVNLRNDLPVCQCSDFTFLNFKNERVSLSNVSLYTL